jgi:pimeloyl-ACP methyl ester carboxylesterase
VKLLPRTSRARGAIALTGVLAVFGLAVVPIRAAAARANSTTPTPRNRPSCSSMAWADGSSWNRVARLLEKDGYTVKIPPIALRCVTSDATYLDAYIKATVPSGPVVLVGHSYGGSVITYAALGVPNVKALVYVNAYIPDVTDTIGGLTSAQPGSMLLNPGALSAVPIPGRGGDADLYIVPSVFHTAIAADLTAARATLMQAGQRPLTQSLLSEPSGTPAWATIPSWSIFGSHDNAIPPAEQIFMANRAHAHTTEINASHVSMISQPDMVANVIERAVHATS